MLNLPKFEHDTNYDTLQCHGPHYYSFIMINIKYDMTLYEFEHWNK